MRTVHMAWTCIVPHTMFYITHVGDTEYLHCEMADILIWILLIPHTPPLCTEFFSPLLMIVSFRPPSHSTLVSSPRICYLHLIISSPGHLASCAKVMGEHSGRKWSAREGHLIGQSSERQPIALSIFRTWRSLRGGGGLVSDFISNFWSVDCISMVCVVTGLCIGIVGQSYFLTPCWWRRLVNK